MFSILIIYYQVIFLNKYMSLFKSNLLQTFHQCRHVSHRSLCVQWHWLRESHETVVAHCRGRDSLPPPLFVGDSIYPIIVCCWFFGSVKYESVKILKIISNMLSCFISVNFEKQKFNWIIFFCQLTLDILYLLNNPPTLSLCSRRVLCIWKDDFQFNFRKEILYPGIWREKTLNYQNFTKSY